MRWDARKYPHAFPPPTNGPHGGGKSNHLPLMSKQSVSAKRMKRARPDTAPLFAMSQNGMHEKHYPEVIGGTELCAIPVIGHYIGCAWTQAIPANCESRCQFPQ
jgi:hypothetical protein